MKEPRFLLAENLNKLAQYLRFLGYDAALIKSISFTKKINLCNKERRIYLTRSNKEAKSNHKFSRILINGQFVQEQIKELSDYIVFAETNIFTRCSKCNSLLNKIDQEKIKSFVPPYIFEHHDQFRICRKCGKIYWKGTHFDHLSDELNRLVERNGG